LEVEIFGRPIRFHQNAALTACAFNAQAKTVSHVLGIYLVFPTEGVIANFDRAYQNGNPLANVTCQGELPRWCWKKTKGLVFKLTIIPALSFHFMPIKILPKGILRGFGLVWIIPSESCY